MSLTAAMEEAYASNPAGETILETVELNHITFAEPLRFVTGVEEDMNLPLEEGGAPVLFIALQVSITLPGETEDGPSPIKLKIDNVSGMLFPHLRDATQAAAPIEVTYRAYTTTDLSQPGDYLDGYSLRDVELTALSAEGSLTLKQIELQAFPNGTYDSEFFPTLQNN